jgi:hypothetical protein
MIWNGINKPDCKEELIKSQERIIIMYKLNHYFSQLLYLRKIKFKLGIFMLLRSIIIMIIIAIIIIVVVVIIIIIN